jgi:transcriptional regulator with XRE-family HTH domain
MAVASSNGRQRLTGARPKEETFTAEFERLRRRRGLSYWTLAARTGLSQTYLNDLGRGRRGLRPSLATVCAIAAALDVAPDAFRFYRQAVVLEQHPEAIDEIYRELHDG